MALLVLGDLGVDIVGFGADDDRDRLESGSLCGTQAFRAEQGTVAAYYGGWPHNDRLKNAAQSNVLGELGDFCIGKLGPRVAGVFPEAADRNEQGAAVSESVWC